MDFDTVELGKLAPPSYRRSGDPRGRQHRDYRVNGKNLSRLFPGSTDLSPFGWLDAATEAQFARWLLLARPAPLDGQRVPLYVCSECADLGCGAITVRVEKHADRFIWKELGGQSSAVPGVTPLAAGYEFHFAREAYESVFRPLG